MDQKHRLAPSAIEAHGFLICHRADQGDCLLLGVVGGRCWGLVPGQHADLPNVALTAQLWIRRVWLLCFFSRIVSRINDGNIERASEGKLNDYLFVRCPDTMNVICRKHEK